MRYFIFQKHRFFVITILAFFLGILLSLLGMDSEAGLFEKQMQGLYFSVYMDTIPGFLMTLIPFCIFTFMLSDSLRGDVERMACYCLTRMRRIGKWYAGKLIVLCFLSFWTVFCLRVSGLIVLQLTSPMPYQAWKETLLPMLQAFLLAWLFVFVVSVIINVVSLKVPVKWCILGIMVIFSGCSVWGQVTYSGHIELGWLNPLLHFSYMSHSEAMKWMAEGMSFHKLPHSTLSVSWWYWGICLIIAVACGYMIVKNIDFGLLKEEG